MGNLVARVSNLLDRNGIETGLSLDLEADNFITCKKRFEESFDNYRFNEALQIIQEKVKECDEELSRKTPWKLSDKEEIAAILKPIAQTILNLSYLLRPFIPQAAPLIERQFLEAQIKKGEPLFPRLA